MKRRRLHAKRKENTCKRINILMYGIFFVSSIFVFRLFSIQVLNHDKYKALAEEQHWLLQDIPSKRGNIYSADGYPLATTQSSYLLFGEPKNILNPQETATALANILAEERKLSGEEKDEFVATRVKRYSEVLGLDLYWVALEHNITPFEREAIEKHKLKAIGFEEEPKRYYPEGTLAAHVLGFVASNEDGQRIGYFGVEGSLDGDLKGKPGRIIEEKDATGAPILVGGYQKVAPIDGRNVVLTINRAVQYIVEKELSAAVKEYGAVSGSVIVMDPYTGDIIALANYPTYDPGDFNYEGDTDVEDSENAYTVERRNLAIAETYEPGSVIKALTVSTGINSGKISPNTTFVDDGPATYSGHTIDNWDGKHHGVQTITQLLQKSNNIGSAWVGHLVGAKTLHKYLREFGLGEITGVSLEGEDTGIIRNYKEWTDIGLANAAFGQGISATPLQVINAFNAIANGGVLMQPRIVTHIEDEGEVINLPPKEIRRVMDKESSDTVSTMLYDAVEGGESKYFNIKNYNVAGKTGTAQIPIEGKYDPSKTNATFVGFLYNSRKFSMIVRLDRPESSVYAAETAVPLWMSIAEKLVNYYGIPPDK